MNRLNFTQMVNKTLNGHQENKFFNIAQLNSEDFYENQRYTAKIKRAQEKLNLESKINDIVFNVHQKLRGSIKNKNMKFLKLNLLYFPERQSSPDKVKSKPIKKKFQSKHKTENIKTKNLTIPRLKVLTNEKHQKNVHSSTMTSSNIVSYEDHQRMLKAVKRQKLLENMLQDQKNIRQDRRTIAQDIFTMRHCLDDLQYRVNSSLRQLDSQQTYCERHGIRNGRNC